MLPEALKDEVRKALQKEDFSNGPECCLRCVLSSSQLLSIRSFPVVLVLIQHATPPQVSRDTTKAMAALKRLQGARLLRQEMAPHVLRCLQAL